MCSTIKSKIKDFGTKRLADALGVTKGAVSQWKRVPAERVLEVERITGISRHDIRPDLYPRGKFRAGVAA